MPNEIIVNLERLRPFLVFGFELYQPLCSVCLLIVINDCVMRPAHQNEVGEAVPFSGGLPIVVARASRFGAIDVADFTDYGVTLDQGGGIIDGKRSGCRTPRTVS